MVKLTPAFAVRAPDESETVPENAAVEASVWPRARDRAVITAKAAKTRSADGKETLNDIVTPRSLLPAFNVSGPESMTPV